MINTNVIKLITIRNSTRAHQMSGWRAYYQGTAPAIRAAYVQKRLSYVESWFKAAQNGVTKAPSLALGIELYGPLTLLAEALHDAPIDLNNKTAKALKAIGASPLLFNIAQTPSMEEIALPLAAQMGRVLKALTLSDKYKEARGAYCRVLDHLEAHRAEPLAVLAGLEVLENAGIASQNAKSNLFLPSDYVARLKEITMANENIECTTRVLSLADSIAKNVTFRAPAP